MKKIDIRFDGRTLGLLQSLIGKEIEYFSCQHLPYTSKIYAAASLKIDGQMYSITNIFETMDYMNAVEDVGVFKFKKTDAENIEEFIEGEEVVQTPVWQNIAEIRIMNENQQLFYKGVQTYDVKTIRGIVFVLEDGLEISFEKDIWFSEMINIRTGRSLMDEYNSMDEFLYNWDGYPDYATKGSREIITIK